MPHCTKCGAAVADNAAFCPSCGATLAAGAPSAPATAIQTGLSENSAGLLCYLVGWITGLIFYFTDKRPYVRFHAAQSIVVFGGLHIISIILGMVLGVGMFVPHAGLAAGGMAVGLWSILGIVEFVLWIVLMIMAFQGKKFRVPIAADLADQIFKP